MEWLIAGSVLSSLGILGILILAASLALPLAWLWMLIDALLRDESEYPGATGNDKLLWVLLILFVHITALAYFFVVYRAVRRGSVSRPAPVAG